MVVGAGLELALGGVIMAVDALRDTIRNSIQFGENADKASLALGLSLDHTNQTLTPTMQGLRGDLTQRFGAAIAGLEVGMQGNTEGLAKLVNQQKLTATQSKNTAMIFAKMESQLGLSRDATDHLSKTFIKVGDEWTVSTDHLVDAMSALEKSFPAQKLAGMGAEVAQAVATLTAELGPSMKGPMENVMKAIMDTSQQGFEKLTMLGIGRVREQLAAARSTEEATIILKDAIKTAGKTTKDFAGGSDKFFRMVGVTTETFGQASMDMMMVSDAFGERIKKESDDVVDFGAQLSVIKGEVLLPLQEAFLALYPTIKDVAILFGGFLKGVIETLVIKVLDLWIELGGLEGIIETVKTKWTEFKDLIVKVSGYIETTLLIALGLWAAKMTYMATITIVKVIFSFMSFVAAMLPVIWPFVAIAAVATAIVAAFGFLLVKTGIMGKVFDGIKWLFVKWKNFVGSLLEMLGNKLPFIGDTLTKWGKSLQESTAVITDPSSAVAGDVDDAARDAKTKAQEEREKAKKRADLLAKVSKMGEAARENLGFNKKTSDHTGSIDKKTKELEVKTTPDFLNETANMLGRSIEGILGVGRDTIAEDMLEEMIKNREAADRAADAAEEKASSPIPEEA